MLIQTKINNMSHTLFSKVNAVLGIASLAIGGLAFSFSPTANAAGVVTTVTPNVRAVSTAGTVTLGYTSTAVVPITGNIRVAFNNTYGGAAAATFTINGVAPSAFPSAVSGGTRTYTLTPGASVAVGAVSIVISGLTTPATQGNYPFTVFTSTNDYGGNFQYVGQANVVNVRAVVPISLSFVIRNTGDTADTNTCDMGDLSTVAVGTCSYRLKVGGNPTNGFTISVATSGVFTNGTYNFSDAAIGSGGSGGTNIVAGTERYGALITKGSITNGTTTLAAVYDAGLTNSVSYVNAAPATLVTYSGPNNPGVSGDTTNTVLVAHNAGISSNTAAGLYTQTVTYTVNPSF